MTNAQIKHILSENGYSANTWDTFDKFSVIFLGQDANVYPNAKTTRIRFNTTNELLELSFGRLNSAGVFVSSYGETESYTPNCYIEFFLIDGFIQTTEYVGCSSVQRRMFKG